MQNIFKKLNSLNTPECFKIINPVGLLDMVLSCFKFLISHLSLYRAEPLRYNQSIQRKGYTIISWTADEVLDTSAMRLAGMPENSFNVDFPYRVKNIPEFEVIGCGYTNRTAVKNIDYIYSNDCYWFREDPSIFCYSYKEQDKIKYYTIAFCSNYIKLQKSYAPTSDIESTPSRVQMYDNLISNGLYGISNALFLNEKGIISNNGIHGRVKFSWHEKDYTFVITDTGTFLAIPDTLGISINYGERIKLDYV